MDWLDFKIEVPAEQKELAEYIAGSISSQGIYIEDYTDVMEQALEIAHIDLVDEQLLKRDKSVVIIHIYLNEENRFETILTIKDRLSKAGITYRITSDMIGEEDWANNWKQYFHQIEVGEKLTICPHWEKPESDNGRKVLLLEPGLAFGTGTHATTALCLETLERYVKQGDTVLDIGCGSGILSIASLILGAQSAVGVDIDEKAVKTACENARLNGFDGTKANFLQGNLADKVSGRYSFIVANIVADVILKLIKDVPGLLQPNGVFIVSGIIDSRVCEVCESFSLYGFEIREHIAKDEWNCFVLAYIG